MPCCGAASDAVAAVPQPRLPGTGNGTATGHQAVTVTVATVTATVTGNRSR